MKPRPYIVNSETTRSAAMASVGMLNVTGKVWDITIEPHRERRSLSQNRLMWSWINEVAEHVHEATGQGSDEIHEFFKGQFLPRRVIEIGGVVENAPGSTKKLSKAEMSEYMNKIYAWATSEMGLLLPVPEDLGRAA